MIIYIRMVHAGIFHAPFQASLGENGKAFCPLRRTPGHNLLNYGLIQNALRKNKTKQIQSEIHFDRYFYWNGHSADLDVRF
jgi:hypothetical protein